MFFMRVQDSCEPIPTSMLRTMFYPQIEPFCRIDSTLSLSMNESDSTFKLRLTFSITNQGSGSAEDLCIYIDQLALNGPPRFHLNESNWRRRRKPENIFDCGNLIHPQESIELGAASHENWIHTSCAIEICFQARIYSRHASPLMWRGVVPLAKIVELIERRPIKPEEKTDVLIEQVAWN
jgi:hypothetical protein